MLQYVRGYQVHDPSQKTQKIPSGYKVITSTQAEWGEDDTTSDICFYLQTGAKCPCSISFLSLTYVATLMPTGSQLPACLLIMSVDSQMIEIKNVLTCQHK